MARANENLEGARRGELEGLRLIADGLSNAETARDLFVSEQTVKSHVSNILSKLHLSDRTQAAVYAWRQGAVRRDQQPRYLTSPGLDPSLDPDP